MPSISGWALRPSSLLSGVIQTKRFLCPRYRAGLCDGRVVEVLLTCGFAGRCANRRAKAARIAPIRAHPRRRVAEQGILTRQPRRKTTIRGYGCTGSCDDPEVLAFLDDASADHSYPPRRTLIKRVQAHLILDRVDQIPERRLQHRRRPPSRKVALEHAQLSPRAVARQQRRHILAAAIVRDVVGHHVPHRTRQTCAAGWPVTSIAPAGRRDPDPGWRGPGPWPAS